MHTQRAFHPSFRDQAHEHEAFLSRIEEKMRQLEEALTADNLCNSLIDKRLQKVTALRHT